MTTDHLAASCAYWLSVLAPERADEDRLACELGVDLRTVRRWRAGQLTPPRSVVLAMRALYALRVAAADAARYVWTDADSEWQARVDGLVHVAVDPVDHEWRERRRREARTITMSGPSARGGGV